MRTLRVGLAQINTTVGDLAGNVRKILEYVDRARALGVDVVSFPELAVTGYPPEDLVLRRRFLEDNRAALQEVVRGCTGITAVVGFVDAAEDIYNAAAVIHDGRLVGVYHKQYLPNYGVFDEDRYFQAGAASPVFEVAGVKLGVNICEDIWYPGGPAWAQAHSGAEVIVNINGSPYYAGKREFRLHMLATRATDNLVFICYTNQVGGQDELVFDGNSVVFDPTGRLVAEGPQFQEALVVADLDVERVLQTRLHDSRLRKERRDYLLGDGVERIVVSQAPPAAERPPLPPAERTPLRGEAELYAALVLGTGDYVRKSGFEKVVIGLSGGIDSSLTAAIAVDALGRENVVGVSMPSRYSSPGSRTDAEVLAANLGIEYRTIPIEQAFAAMLETLSPEMDGAVTGLAQENLQPRIRANFLMALANRYGWLVLATGNKSETATGYTTIYGDMAGAFAPLKDVLKTEVYALARYRNGLPDGPVIPQSVLEKPPSAELRPEQKDEDSLPPYRLLDPILRAYVEQDKSLEEIVAMGYEPELVRRVITLVHRSEYKRRQAPPGVKVSPRAFGRDRRLPIANRYVG